MPHSSLKDPYLTEITVPLLIKEDMYFYVAGYFWYKGFQVISRGLWSSNPMDRPVTAHVVVYGFTCSI